MTDQRTLMPVGAGLTSERSDAPTVAGALIALRRVETRPAAAFPLDARPSMSSVEHAKALYCAKMGKTRL
jgi:hypothetical protein